jgi:bifunctional UDP-N-acetylglucosamine pyrophosphorylase/glucosamine-1-phosphate N-acetyltransferase
MQAVILAAGEGVRLRPLTLDRPKPMVRIGGKPILEYTLSILPKEVDEVILVVGYKQEKIKEHFGDEWQGRRLTYVRQPEQKGTGEALARARHHLNGDPFLMLFADDLYHPADLVLLAASEHPAVVVKEKEHPERFGVCVISDDGFLQELIEKPENPPSSFVNVGPSLLHHDIFDFDIEEPLLPNGESCLPEQISRLAKKRPVRVLRARFWHPIGYPEDVQRAEQYINLPPEERMN